MSRLIPPPFNDAMVQAAIAEWDWPAHYYEDRYYWSPSKPAASRTHGCYVK